MFRLGITASIDKLLSFTDEFNRHFGILVSIVVLVFDHCLTFLSEIEHIWQKKKTPFSCLFLLNRYFALLAMLAYTAFYIIHTESHMDFELSDNALNELYIESGGARPLLFAFTIVTSLTAEAAITLRAYAVHQNSKPVLLMLSAVWITHLVISIKICTGPIAGSSYVDAVAPGSLHIQALGPTLGDSDGVLFVMPAIIFDIIAGGFLTLGLYRKSGPDRVQMPLTRLIIRDGLLYFAVVFVSNTIWVVVHILNKYYGYDLTYLYLTPIEVWCGCITTTMISRLTLNLKMYDPAAQNELTFQTMSLMFRQTRQLSTTDEETRQARGSSSE